MEARNSEYLQGAALRTCSYWKPPTGFTVVRTSLGTPEGMEHLPRLVAAAPPKAIWGTEDFAQQYRDVLDRRTASLLRTLERLLSEHGPLAFACYEPDPGSLEHPKCHRIVLADWLAGHGYRVVVA